MNISAKLLCPSCRGSRMVLGTPAASNLFDAGDSHFRPMGTPMFLGFQTHRVACLDCGYVGTCLNENERSELEEKLRKA